MRFTLIAAALYASVIYISQTHAQNTYGYERAYDYQAAADRNRAIAEQQLRRDMSGPKIQQPQGIFSPRGQWQGYTEADRQGNINLYSPDGVWMGTVR